VRKEIEIEEVKEQGVQKIDKIGRQLREALPLGMRTLSFAALVLSRQG
jgi:hypothetical protein